MVEIIDLGRMVRQQVESVIADQMKGHVRKMLRQALPTVERAVESLCPFMVEKRKGLRIHYGPDPRLANLEENEQLFIFVTNHDRYIGGPCAWLPDEFIAKLTAEAQAAVSPEQYGASVWSALYTVIEDQERAHREPEEVMSQLLNLWAMRIGAAGQAKLIDCARFVKHGGYLPVVLTISVRDAKAQRCGGTTGMVILPPPIRLDA
jgi:hypothetical protein